MWWIILLIIVLSLIILYQVFLYLEDKTFFCPSSEHVWKPEEPYREVSFRESPQDPRLHGWYFPIEHKPVILFCHGNTGNISHRQYVVDLCREINLSLFLFDYRGYGKSEGRPSLGGIKRDGEAAYNYLRSIGYQGDQIIVWGESLGGIVATHIASTYPCSRLLLLSTFADLTSLVTDESSILTKLSYPIISLRQESNLERIKKISVPTLIIHSINDDLIPYFHTLQLYQAINHSWKQLITIDGYHGNPRFTPENIREIMRFCWQEPIVTPRCLDLLTHIATVDNKHV